MKIENKKNVTIIEYYFNNKLIGAFSSIAEFAKLYRIHLEKNNMRYVHHWINNDLLNVKIVEDNVEVTVIFIYKVIGLDSLKVIESELVNPKN